MSVLSKLPVMLLDIDDVDIVVKNKKEVVDSKSKFEIGKFRYKYENNFDGETTIYYFYINITKITKCYIWVDIYSQYNTQYSRKIWKDKCEMSEYIYFSIFNISCNELEPY